jgi:hypothetical protein
MKNKDYNTAYDNFWRAIQVEPQYQPAYEAFVAAASKTHQEKEAYLLLQNWTRKHPHLDPAQKALKALAPAANKPPELTPLNSDSGTPDITIDRPQTLKTPSKPASTKPSEKAAVSSTDKPQMTSAGSSSAKSRISPLKPVTPQTATPKINPEATSPGD